ncbi:MAG: glucose-1-phosphate adenylyltransferase [Actinomycetota bacterium]|nr:glucose-1-phosphate adenylyltransferase [Sporichthyaceae bacterium]MDQ3112530.1 glucose-1-phosphate adenylyltransferase [Actinomycetota bacterium]MDQ3450231.1 glucose-1-phosphate adenylyltransferase [Actinomycetota bacterium]
MAGRVLAMVLAGGEGKRLMPLTADRAKPAVPFGGTYRLIDFVLSNLVNAGYLRIAVLTQYKSHSLDRHIALTWDLSTLLGNYVTGVPAQQRLGPRWYAGSADAIFQNLNLLYDERPEHVVVFGADHVYRMDASQMVAQHRASNTGVTVAGIRVPRADAAQFGVIDTSAGSRVIDAFLEKPTDPDGLPDSPDEVFASMGNYVFTTETLLEAITADAADDSSQHDMGGDIIPRLVRDGAAEVYDFADNAVPGATERDRGYWRDVGTIASFFDAHMDLVSVHPIFNLYNDDWPIATWHPQQPGPKFVQDGQARDTLIGLGSIVSGSIERSVIGHGARIHRGARVEESVLHSGVTIGEGATVRRAILDKHVFVPPGAQIGVDHDADRQRGYTVSDEGIVVLGKAQPVIP